MSRWGEGEGEGEGGWVMVRITEPRPHPQESLTSCIIRYVVSNEIIVSNVHIVYDLF